MPLTELKMRRGGLPQRAPPRCVRWSRHPARKTRAQHRAEGRIGGLARRIDGDAPLFQKLPELFELRALAAAVRAFEDDEFSSLAVHMPIIANARGKVNRGRIFMPFSPF